MKISKKENNLNKVLKVDNSLEMIKHIDMLNQQIKTFIDIMPDMGECLNEKFLQQTNDALKSGVFDKAMFEGSRKGLFQFDISKGLIMEMIRGEYIRHYGFIALNKELLEDLSNFLMDKKVMDAGAGNGFLSSKLIENNVDVTPVDFKVMDNDYVYKKNYCEIVDMDAVKYLEMNIRNIDTILLSWPPMNSFAHNILDKMVAGQKLVYIGERGGCTADDRFFNLLIDKAVLNSDETNQLNRNFTNFPAIRDSIYVYDIN